MVIKKCSCGSKEYEEIDITPAGTPEKRHFTRCKCCGLVVSVHETCSKENEESLLAHVLRVIQKQAARILDWKSHTGHSSS